MIDENNIEIKTLMKCNECKAEFFLNLDVYINDKEKCLRCESRNIKPVDCIKDRVFC